MYYLNIKFTFCVISFQMKFQANDHQALKEIADEIILFEGIQHQNLVKYYGVEVHKVSPNSK